MKSVYSTVWCSGIVCNRLLILEQTNKVAAGISCHDFTSPEAIAKTEEEASKWIALRIEADRAAEKLPPNDYPGKGIFVITITEKSLVQRIWLIVATSCEGAEVAFRLLDEKEKAEGGQPLILPGRDISVEPLEFERGVSQMW